MRRRIVITGLGLVTPLGTEVEAVWKRLLAGESAVDYISLFDAGNFPTKIAAEVRGWDLSAIGEDPAKWQHQDRHTQFAVGAAHQAMKDAGLLDAKYDPTRFGVYTGSGEGKQDFGLLTEMILAGLKNDSGGVGQGFDPGAYIEKGLAILHPTQELEQEPSMPAAHIAAMFDLRGPNINCLTACAASSQAIGEAAEIIRRGEADVMVAGGAHSMIHPFGVTGFNLLTALSTSNDEPKRASRPFDKNRNGFVLGEGAAIIILEELEHAKKRGAKIYAELAGYGATADAYRITDIHPEARGPIGCFKMAIEDAGIDRHAVQYVNAHGTSTSVNDRVETMAIKAVMGDHAYKVPVSSTKSMTGHLIGAAGASETIYCIMAIRDNILPPTINYETPDPECDLDYIPNKARETKCDIAATNSFGFGGQNVTLIVRRFVD